MSSLRQKVRAGRYNLGLVLVSGGYAFAAIHPTLHTVSAFGHRYPDKISAQAEALRKYKRPAMELTAEVQAEPLPDNVTALRERAKAAGVKGYSKLNKAALIAALAPERLAA